MQKAIIFLAGAICGITFLFAGIWLWSNIILGWLPYSSPDPQIVSHIESVAVKRHPDLAGKETLSLDEYRRWYVKGSENGHAVIWGTWDIPDPAKYPHGVVLGHRRFPPGFLGMLGGGCSQVHLTYNLQSSQLSMWCNAPM
jgi:hypothetical protein